MYSREKKKKKINFLTGAKRESSEANFGSLGYLKNFPLARPKIKFNLYVQENKQFCWLARYQGLSWRFYEIHLDEIQFLVCLFFSIDSVSKQYSCGRNITFLNVKVFNLWHLIYTSCSSDGWGRKLEQECFTSFILCFGWCHFLSSSPFPNSLSFQITVRKSSSQTKLPKYAWFVWISGGCDGAMEMRWLSLSLAWEIVQHYNDGWLGRLLPSCTRRRNPRLVIVSCVCVPLCWEEMCCWLGVVIESPLQFGGAHSALIVWPCTCSMAQEASRWPPQSCLPQLIS